VDAADDDGLVGIAFEEVDDHFLADTGNRNRAPALTGPGGRDADPAGAVFVLFPFPVPVKLYFHAAVLVGVNFFGGGADHDGSLAALDKWLRRDARRAERRGGWNTFEGVSVREPFPIPSGADFVVLLSRDVVNRSKQILLVEVRPI